MKTITYKKASSLVKKVKDGLIKNILCIVVVDKECPVCFDMTDDILPRVEEKFNSDIDFVELNLDSEDLIFPPVKVPVCFFYVRSLKKFPIIRTGPAPLEAVIQDVEEMIKFNRENNG